MSLHLNHDAPKMVYKAWGTETWHVLSADFCVKTIKLLKGCKTSYQWHRQKEEINFIESGEAEVWLEDAAGVIQKHVVRPGDSFFVPVTRKHRVIALTDLEMFEVSNEYVDDVVRIADEFGRGDGKIEDEHKTPAALILAAGLGSRLKHLTAYKNKALIPVADQAVISHIIGRFPTEYEIVVAVGYKQESLIAYCQLAHPDRRFQFVAVDGWDNPATDPGHSALACSVHLQRPFYLVAVDCLLEGAVPHLDGNWIGAYPTDYPEKYATLRLNGENVAEVVNKRPDGFDQAFMGIAAVRDYRVFWEQLAASPRHELVAAWKDVSKYPVLKAKNLRWFDAGNLDDLAAARDHFENGSPLGSPKGIDEVTYHVGGRVLKFHPGPDVTRNRMTRGMSLSTFGLTPDNLARDGDVLAYDWVPGENLYQTDSLALYGRFLRSLGRTISLSPQWRAPDLITQFYVLKTEAREAQFRQRYGDRYFTDARTINGVAYPTLNDLIRRAFTADLGTNLLYGAFHGDLHFDNIIYNSEQNRFVYVDWRESFAGDTIGGDLYYDLGKLYAGCLLPFELLKSDSTVELSEGSSVVSYSYAVSPALRDFTREYEEWLFANGYDLTRVRLIAGLAFLNIAPLHSDTWNRVLLYKAIETLHAATR